MGKTKQGKQKAEPKQRQGQKHERQLSKDSSCQEGKRKKAMARAKFHG